MRSFGSTGRKPQTRQQSLPFTIRLHDHVSQKLQNTKLTSQSKGTCGARNISLYLST